MQPDEIRLIHPGPGMGWEWAALAQGKTWQRVMETPHHPTPADALQAALCHTQAESEGAA